MPPCDHRWAPLLPCTPCSKINWNPGLSLYAKDSSTLVDAAPLSRSDQAAAAVAPQQQHLAPGDGQPAAASAGGLSAGAIAGIVVASVIVAAAAAAATLVVRQRRRRRRGAGVAAGLRLSVVAKRTASGADQLPPEVAVVSPSGGTLTTPRQRASPPRSALSPVGVAEVETDATRSSLDSNAPSGLQLLAGGPSSSQQQLGGSSGSIPAVGGQGGVAAPDAAAAAAAADDWVPGGAAAPAHGSGSGPDAAAAAGAEGTAAEGVAALAWAAELLAGQAPGWQQALVSESDITFMTAPDGRRISLGAGASGHVCVGWGGWCALLLFCGVTGRTMHVCG